MDTNAVPFLVPALNQKQGQMRKLYEAGWRHLPHWLQNMLPKPLASPMVIHMNAAIMLGKMGPGAKPAIPALIRTLKEDDDAPVRLLAAQSLWQIDRNDAAIKEALMTATQDTNSAVRLQAQMLLNTFDLYSPSARSF